MDDTELGDAATGLAGTLASDASQDGIALAGLDLPRGSQANHYQLFGRIDGGGMGDILTGVIAALLAQGVPAADAATIGVCVHGGAGDRAAAQTGDRGLLATDLLDWLPGQLAQWETGAGAARA